MRNEDIEEQRNRHKEFIIIDDSAEFTPIPQSNIVFEMPAE